MKPLSGKPLAWIVLSGVALLFLLLIGINQISKKASSGYVGLIKLNGMIVADRPFVKTLHKMNDHPMIKAIVVYINSPGGTMASAQSIFEELNKVRQAGKPVVIAMSEYCTSGGYYVACASDIIVANPGSITGSIGVILRYPEAGELMKKLGVGMEVIKSGAYKDVGDFSRKLKTKERHLLQSLIDDLHSQFVDMVVDTRGQKIAERLAQSNNIKVTDLEPQLVRQRLVKLADGRIFSGKQAFKVGLVDQLGNLDDAVVIAGKLAGIKSKPKVLQESGPSFFERIMNSDSNPQPLGQQDLRLIGSALELLKHILK